MPWEGAVKIGFPVPLTGSYNIAIIKYDDCGLKRSFYELPY